MTDDQNANISSRESNINFSDVEEGMDVGVECVMPLLGWYGRKVCICILGAVIEYSGEHFHEIQALLRRITVTYKASSFPNVFI